MLNMQSFFARVGGKSKQAKRIVELLPPHTTYCEPFVGAGSILLRKPISNIEIINDNCEDIINLWKDFKSNAELITTYTFKSSRTKFYELKKVCPDQVEGRLFRNLFLSKFSFAGNRKDYAPCIKTTCINLKRNFQKYKDRLQDVNISLGDYKDCIQKHDSLTTLFYIDPPYETGRLVQHWNYIPSIRKDLRECLRTIKGMFIMSYEHSPDICTYFKEFNQSFLDTHYSSGNRSHNTNRKRELILTNFK